MKDGTSCFWFGDGRRVVDFEFVAAIDFEWFDPPTPDQPEKSTIILAGGNKIEIRGSDSAKLFAFVKERWPERCDQSRSQLVESLNKEMTCAGI